MDDKSKEILFKTIKSCKKKRSPKKIKDSELRVDDNLRSREFIAIQSERRFLGSESLKVREDLERLVIK